MPPPYKPIQAPPELVKPDYNVYSYANGIFKVVRFRSTAPRMIPSSARKRSENPKKLEASLSRARRMVLEYALCNDWDWFCTLTLDPDKWNRFDLTGWHKAFMQWIRDERKKGHDINFVLVPEKHQDGAWHAHGLFKGDVPLVSFRELAQEGVNLPDKLIHGDFFNWQAYQQKFGFCSFGKIRNQVAVAFYVTKYISKSIGADVSAAGVHLYWVTRPLKKAVLHGEVYGNCGYLDGFLQNHYEYCDTGMTHVRDGLDWTFALDYMMLESMDDIPSTEEESEVEEYMETVEQMVFQNF